MQPIKQSWLPLIVVSLTGLALVFNIASLTTAIGDIVESLAAPVATIQLAVVAYSLLVAAFTITGGKVTALWGARAAHLTGLVLLTVAVSIIAFAPSIDVLIAGQAIAGLAGALLIPSSVAVVVQAYEGEQRTLAVAIQAALTGIVAALSLLCGGTIVSLFGWRAPYFILLALLAANLALATRLRLPAERDPEARLEFTSVVLSAAGVILMIVGVNQVGAWGLLAANPSAPFDLFGVSPALLMLMAGGLTVSLFLGRQERLRTNEREPLLAPEVLKSRTTRASLLVLLAANLVIAGIVYLLLLYTQMVLNYSAIRSAVSLLPMSLAGFFAATAVPALSRRWPPRLLVAAAYVLAFAATLLLAGAVTNAFNAPALWLAEVLIGAAVGVLFAIGSAVLVESAPSELSAEIGSARGVATFLGNALGIAIAGAVLLSVLARTAATLVDQHAQLSLPESVELSPTSVLFVSNEQLEELLSRPPWKLSAAQLREAVEINVQARLAALKASLTVLALLALIGIATARSLPDRSATAPLLPVEQPVSPTAP